MPLRDHFHPPLSVQRHWQGNLFAELLDWLAAPPAWTTPPSLYAAAARVQPAVPARLGIWTETLGLGAKLPTLPLWLNEDLAVPVNLVASYRAACEVLRIDRFPS